MNYDPFTGKPLRKDTDAQPQSAPQPASRTAAPSEPPQAPGKRTYTMRETLFAWLCVPLCYFFVQCFPASRTPLGSLFAILSLYLFGLVFLFAFRVRPRPATYLLPVFAVITSFGLILGGNQTTRFFLFLFLLLLFPFWIADAAGTLGKGLLDRNVIQQILNGLVAHPFSGIPYFLPALVVRKKKDGDRKKTHTVMYILLGLVIAIVPTLVIASILAAGDEQFRKLLSKILDIDLSFLTSQIGRLLLAIPFMFLLFGTLYHTLVYREKEQPQPVRQGNGLHFVPQVLLCAAVTPILLLYLLFFISQRSYYLSAFTHELPAGLTYAQYAREGFFQLVAVCIINALILLLFHVLAAKREGLAALPHRIYSAVFSVASLVLAATALSKMILYMDSYGLTHKRLLATWFILFLSIVFLSALIRQIVRKFPLQPVIVAAALLFWAVLVLPNHDGIIARSNVDRYLSGELPTVDVAAMDELGSSAVPSLCKLSVALRERSNDPDAEKLLMQVDRCIARKRTELNRETGFFDFNLPDYRARQTLKTWDGN